MKKRKKTFLLLEVLIAFTLVALCILPLLSPHVAIYKDQKKFLNEIELNHDVHLLYVTILEKMHKGEIALGDIFNKRVFSISTDHLQAKQIEASYFFTPISKKKQSDDGFNVHLANLTILLKDKHKPFIFDYLVFFASLTNVSQDEKESTDENS